MPKLILFPGSDDQSEIDLTGRDGVALGRSEQCDVVVHRRMASRTHALIERRNGRYFIRDTDSYNGTFINNKPVREAQLVHGDEIRIANRSFRFVEVGDPAMDRTEPGDTLRLRTAPLDDQLLEVAQDDLDGVEEPEERATPGDAARALRGTEPLSTGAPAPARTPGERDTAPSARSLAATTAAVRPPAEASSLDSPATAGTSRLAVGTRPASVWPLVTTLVILAALIAAGIFWLRRPLPEMRTEAPTIEEIELREALAATGEERLDRLWKFVETHPVGGKAGDAYLALLSNGATELAVCEHARRKSPSLLEPSGPLAERCTRTP